MPEAASTAFRQAQLLPLVERHMGMRVLRWSGSAPECEALVLLHGMGDGADVWRATVARLRTHSVGEVIAIELPGHWGSDWQADGHYRLERMATQVATVISTLSQRPISLAGHSLGGRLAALLASRGAVDLAAVILIDLSPEPSDQGQNAVYDHIEALNEPPFLGARLSEIATSRLPFCTPEAVTAYLQAAVEALPGGARRAVDPSVMEIDVTLDDIPMDLWQLFEQIRCPVGILRGAYSSLLPAPVAHRAALRVRQCCGYHTIPRAGHAIPLEQPAHLADKIMQCLTEAQSPKTALW